MNTYKTFFLLTLTLILASSLSSCDDPTGPNLEDEPEPPSLEHVQPDFSVFDDADVSGGAASSEDIYELNYEPNPYEYGALLAVFAESYISSMAMYPQIFFQQEAWSDPEMDGDTWVWNWSYSYEGESLNIEITADDTGDSEDWELRYSFSDGDESVEDALLISAKTYHDGSGGSWQMFDIDEQGTPAFEVTYELDDEEPVMIDMSFDDDEEGNLHYERDGDIATLQLFEVYGNESVLEWNKESGAGFIISPEYRDGEQSCWDEDFRETEC